METQAVFRIRGNRRITREHCTVEGDALLIRKELAGWLRFREFVGPVDGLKRLFFLPNNSRHMVIDDSDGFPISPYRPSKDVLEKLCVAEGDDNMADRQSDFQLTKQTSDEKKHWYYDSMALAIMGIVFTVVLLAILFVSGKFNLAVR